MYMPINDERVQKFRGKYRRVGILSAFKFSTYDVIKF